MDDLLLDLESGGRPRGETAWRKGVRRGSPKPKSGGRRRGKRGGRPFLKALLVLAVLALALGAAFYAWIFLYLPSQDPDGKFDRAAIVASLGSGEHEDVVVVDFLLLVGQAQEFLIDAVQPFPVHFHA